MTPTVDASPAIEAGLAAALAPFTAASGLLVAVSGGPDSMALLRLVAGWAERHDHPPIHAATVDHRLRPGSRAEAETVAALGRSHRHCAQHSDLGWRKACDAHPGAGAGGALRPARRACRADRRRRADDRPPRRRPGRNHPVPPAARQQYRRARRHGLRHAPRPAPPCAAAPRLQQGRSRGGLRSRRPALLARSFERGSALCPHPYAPPLGAARRGRVRPRRHSASRRPSRPRRSRARRTDTRGAGPARRRAHSHELCRAGARSRRPRRRDHPAHPRRRSGADRAAPPRRRGSSAPRRSSPGCCRRCARAGCLPARSAAR